MASPLVIQPGNKDTFLDQNQPAVNYGSLAYWYIRSYTSGEAARRAALEFLVDWSGEIPAEAEIDSAKLYIYYYLHAGAPYIDPVGKQIDVFRLLRLNWVEAQATWNIYKTGSSWTLGGAGSNGNDHTTENGADNVYPADYGWIEFDITEQAKTARSLNVNVACLIKHNDETSYNILTGFYSNNDGVHTDLRPKLSIWWSIPEVGGYIPKKSAFDGYRCFVQQYVKNKVAGTDPWKLPDGTKW